MAKYRVYYSTSVSVGVTVEAADEDEAMDKGFDEIPSGVCAQCSGWGQPWELELGDDWEPDSAELLDAGQSD